MKTTAAGVERVEAKDKRSFAVLVLLTAQNAFNDKAAQILLIILGASLAFYGHKQEAGSLEYLLGGLILAPYIIFSPIAGWVSDRFSKTRVLQAMVLLQMLALGLIFYAVVQRELLLGIFGFAVLAVQSTFISPAKKGIIKEMVGSEKIGMASGVMEVVAVLAICAGQICSGIWFTERMELRTDPWDGAYLMMLVLASLSVPTMLVALVLKYYPSPAGERRPFRAAVWVEHVGQMKDLLGSKKLRMPALSISFFWFFGGFVNLVAFSLGKELSGGDWRYGMELAYFIGSASLGIILGGLVASMMSGRSIELGLVPLGGLAMVLACACLFFTDIHSPLFKWWLGFAGAGGACFLVPLNAYFQDQCEPGERGKMLAGSNLVDCLAGLLAVMLQFGLHQIGLCVQHQFAVIGILSLLMTYFTLRLLPGHYVRYTILTPVRALYRMKVLNKERLPREGGVLVVANHVTYIDAFILTAASQRPLRFLIAEHFMRGRGPMAWFLKAFDCVPISPKKAKQAIEKAVEAIEQGGVVCVFPEGQLTRTGTVNEFKRGVEMIANRAQCPIVPVYMDGLWGSIFSFERRRYFKKWPKCDGFGVTVAWGEPMDSAAFSAVSARERVLQLGKQAWAHREALQQAMRILGKKQPVLYASSELRQELDILLDWQKKMSHEEQRRLLFNAFQLLETPIWEKGRSFAIEMSSIYSKSLLCVLCLYLPRIASQGVVLLSGKENSEEWMRLQKKYNINAVVAGEEWLGRCADAAQGCVYLSPEAHAHRYSVSLTECMGRVLAIELPQSLLEISAGQVQLGSKTGTVGKLLAGYASEDAKGWEVDQEGFVCFRKVDC